MTPVVELEAVSRTYHVGPATVPVLRQISLRIMPGEFVAITGPSGSGKSTLLHLLGLLDRADSGTYRLDGRDIATVDDDELTVIRNRKIGFIFQAAPMLPRLTAAQNVAVPLVYRGERPRHAHAQACRMLARLGLAAFVRHRPTELSGGQLQRVAIARALIGRPRLILADEPTSALDPQTAGETMNLIRTLNREFEAALVLITHEVGDAVQAERRLTLDHGGLQATPNFVGTVSPL